MGRIGGPFVSVSGPPALSVLGWGWPAVPIPSEMEQHLRELEQLVREPRVPEPQQDELQVSDHQFPELHAEEYDEGGLEQLRDDPEGGEEKEPEVRRPPSLQSWSLFGPVGGTS